MRKLVEFYKNLNKQKKIIFWVCIGIIFLSTLRIPVSRIKQRNIPSARRFIKQLKSPNKNEKIDAIFTIGKLKIKSALPEIEDIFQKDPDIKVKRYCAWSIGQIDFAKLLTYLDSPDKTIKEITFETLIAIDKKNIDYLIDRFEKEDEETKFKILSFMNSYEYQDNLIKIIENKNEEVSIRKKALEILKDVGKWEEIEVSLWALYYNEEDMEMKNFIYEIIKEFQKRSKK